MLQTSYRFMSNFDPDEDDDTLAFFKLYDGPDGNNFAFIGLPPYRFAKHYLRQSCPDPFRYETCGLPWVIYNQLINDIFNVGNRTRRN